MSTVFLSGIEFYGYHGESDPERVLGHRFEAEIELEVTERASTTDVLADTVDYAAVAELVVSVGVGTPCRTMERLATTVARRILKEHRGVTEASVEISKMLPPIPVIARAAGVRVTVGRDS